MDLKFGQIHSIAGPGAEQKMLKPVGRCIYCRRTRDEVALEDEHIIPDGLGGDLILPQASCRACAEKINIWEQRVQTRNLQVTRDGAGLKSRKRRGRRARTPKRLYRADNSGRPPAEDELRSEIADPLELPQIVLVETTKGRPEILGGNIPGNGIGVSFVLRKADDQGKFTLSLRTMGGDFLRLIAKIAHGLAVATLGLDGFSPFLVNIILNEGYDESDLWKYIGCQLRSRSHKGLHEVRINDQLAGIRSADGLSTTLKPVVTAEIQLFANYQAPIFEVAVGIEHVAQGSV